MKPVFWLRKGMAALLFITITGGYSLGYAVEPMVAEAPVNPQFLDYMEASEQTPARLFASPAGEQNENALGYIPSPVDYSYLKGQQIEMLQSSIQEPLRMYLSQQYDLRQQNKLTPVRNQKACGDCWAFGAMGTLESFLMSGENRDFSENNLKNKHGFDWGHCSGGNGDMSTAYFTRWAGPVNESDDPYNITSNVSPAGAPIRKHVQEVIIIPPRTSPMDNDAIKQAILDYGALQSSVYADSGATTYTKSADFNPLHNAAYHSGARSPNHIIVIAGWDDNYDKNNFSTIPEGNGAFIVRNSWGEDWGESGYYYVSYYDGVIGHSNNYQFRDVALKTNFARIYQYDLLGKTGSTGYGGNTAWFANVFTATGQDSISAAAFNTASAGSSYELYVYRNVNKNPDSGTLVTSSSGTIPTPGYHTVTFSPVELSNGQRFSIVIKLTTPGYNYPIPLEKPITGYSSGASASAGQSFMSYAGKIWTDVVTKYPNSNVCLKAFAEYVPPAPSALTVNITGKGGGAINSSPSGIACTSRSCQTSFDNDIFVELLATPDSNSIFSGWSDDCSGNDNCNIDMNMSRTVTAIFDPAPLIRLTTTAPAPQPTLQDAYDAAAAGEEIQLKEGTLIGSLVAKRPVDVTVKGGYDAAYTSNRAYTTIQGTVLLRAGTLRMEKVNLR